MDLNFENLIGKSIKDVSILGFTPKFYSTDKSYQIILKESDKFYNFPIANLFAKTDEEGIIDLITINIPKVIDENYFSLLVKEYGYPNSVQKLDKLKSENKSTGQFGQELIKRFYSIKEVKFEDKPFCILWTKASFQIRIIIKHDYNCSQIIFRKPVNHF